ncbi:hypothetical protein D1007_30447 [Hordeum vulgare]|nr:hypothetical protein D1007_30447 [Hordeum vulgare]
MGMTKGMMVGCAALGVLSLLTVILGITGAASTSCGPPPAVGCGVVASLLALTTQIIATAATSCCGCCRTWAMPNESKRIVAIVLSTFSWVLVIVVVILFLVGAVVSTPGGVPTNDDEKCVQPGAALLATATTLFFIAMVCQITSYILLQATSVAGSTKSPLAEESGIAMGQPAAAVRASNAEQKAAAAGDLPPSAPTAAAAGDLPPSVPTASSEANVAPPPPPSAPTMSPKAGADPTSHV